MSYILPNMYIILLIYIILLLLIVVFAARNHLIYKIRIKKINTLTEFEDFKKFKEVSYNDMLFKMPFKWTYKQFYPED